MKEGGVSNNLIKKPFFKLGNNFKLTRSCKISSRTTSYTLYLVSSVNILFHLLHRLSPLPLLIYVYIYMCVIFYPELFEDKLHFYGSLLLSISVYFSRNRGIFIYINNKWKFFPSFLPPSPICVCMFEQLVGSTY